MAALLESVPELPSRELERRRFTFEEVLRMLETGILAEDEPVELLDGELVIVSPQGKDHLWSAKRTRDWLLRAYGETAVVLEDKPILIAPDSGPEPDLAVVRIEVEREDRMPTARDTLLVVEVSVTSQVIDRLKGQATRDPASPSTGGSTCLHGRSRSGPSRFPMHGFSPARHPAAGGRARVLTMSGARASRTSPEPPRFTPGRVPRGGLDPARPGAVAAASRRNR